uniref:TAL bHLH transcription factor 1, erythroid differentiation factor n=1 Tax=Malurus cyaneus samueli TaxID=2593467 RepID=A0A8C5U2E9_9PASS
AMPARPRHDSEAETRASASSRGGMEAPADPQLLLNGAPRRRAGPPRAPPPLCRHRAGAPGGLPGHKKREAAGEAMQRAPGAEPCRAAEAACEARMVQLSPPALPLQPPGRAMLYNLGQPLATINSGFFGEPDSFSMYGSNRVKRRPSPYEMEITDGPHTKVVRRIFTNSRERWRQQNVNGAFAELQRIFLLNDQEEEGNQRGKVNKDSGIVQEDLLQDMLSPNSSCGSSLDGAASPDSFTEEHEALDSKHTRNLHHAILPVEGSAQR